MAVSLLAGCAPAPRPVEQPKREAGTDATKEEGYRAAVDQLVAMNRRAEDLLAGGKSTRAADIISSSQPVLNRLLSVPQPTLEAMEAVSDSDHLYGRMLLANGHYGWARMAFQKNATRWKTWRPQTLDTARRLKLANDAIAECDRRLRE